MLSDCYIVPTIYVFSLQTPQASKAGRTPKKEADIDDEEAFDESMAKAKASGRKRTPSKKVCFTAVACF